MVFGVCLVLWSVGVSEFVFSGMTLFSVRGSFLRLGV